MSLSTPAQVRSLGGLDGDAGSTLFRLSGEAELDALIEDELAVATAFLTSRAGTNYTQTTDTNLQALMARAEQYFVLAQLFERLKARRVVATHFPYLQEGSDRFQELVDTEWMAQFERLAGPYISEDTAGSPFSAGVFVIGTALDRTTSDCITDINQAILDEANGVCSLP